MRNQFKPAAISGPVASHRDYGAQLTPGERWLAPYAASRSPGRGRLYLEARCPTRSDFQRDRDRIIHASAFRRLTHKTQVFVYHEGDHYRTRLTHTLEVAQIARTVARQLCLDEDLAEALALAHDLGHPPFGHAGERALDGANAVHGGFDHNAQSLRVVTKLERKYAAFDGLNLTFETLEGLIKHNGPLTGPAAEPTRRVIKNLAHWQDFAISAWPCGEAQVAALADDIAYATHDIDDGLRAGLISIDDLATAPLADVIIAGMLPDIREGDPSRRHYDVSRRMITVLIGDLVKASRERLRAVEPTDADAMRRAGQPAIVFSVDMAARLSGLKEFLFAHVYRHPRVTSVMDGAEQIVRDLFNHYRHDRSALPTDWREAALRHGERSQSRVIADFVAGMTDRYAIAEHSRLFDATPELR